MKEIQILLFLCICNTDYMNQLLERVKSEYHLFFSHWSGWIIFISLIVWLWIIIVIRFHFPPWISSTSYVLGLASLLTFMYGLMGYARLKGRSPFWALLGIGGLLALFVLKQKEKSLSIIANEWNYIDMFLFILFFFSFSSFVFLIAYYQVDGIMGMMEHSLFTMQFPISFFVMVVVLIATLILNRRNVLPWSLACSLLLFFSYFLITFKSEAYLTRLYLSYRNLMYILLAVYPIIHFIIIGLIKIRNNSRALFTAEGMLFYYAILLTTSYMYALVIFFVK